MIIEFVGPPGAGKSTVARALGDRLGALVVDLNGYQALDGSPLSVWQRRGDRVVAMATQPRLAIEVARCATSGERGLALSWMVNLVRRNRWLQGVPTHAVVEEGPLHALTLALCERPSWKPSIRLTMPDVVVLVDVPGNIAWKRILDRRGVLSDADERYVLDLVERYRRRVRKVLPEGGVIELDGCQPVEKNVESAAQLLNQP